MNELKSFNVQINQIICLYEALCKDIEDNFFDDVVKEIKKEEKIGKENNEIEYNSDEYEEEEEEEEEDDDDDDDDSENKF